ncbi:MAG: MopE-related protein [Bacteroidota bacterium]
MLQRSYDILMIIPKSNNFYTIKLPLPSLFVALALFLHAPTQAQPNAVLSNPSSCGLNEPLTDNTCPENVNFYNPDVFEIVVTNAPGTQLGIDVYLDEVRLLIEHEWVSDVNVALRSPGGETVELFGNIGGNGDNFGDTSLVNCSGAMVLKLAACDLIADAIPPFADKPYRAMNDFYDFNDGQTDPNGTWELLICDDLEDDVGILQYVELVFAPLSCLPVQDLILLNQDTTSATFSYEPEVLCGSALVEIGPPGFTPGLGETPGEDGEVFSVGCPPFTLTGLPEDTDFDIYIRRLCNGGTTFSANSCGSSFQTGCAPANTSQLETFDQQLTCTTQCGTTCTTTGQWRNVEGDDFDWIVHTGSTPTLVGTGPNDDITGGGNYVYIEANGSQCTPGAEAYLQSSCILLDKQGTDSCHLSFYYHMSGLNSGSLRVEASDDGGLSWTPQWQVAGRQGADWQNAYVSLADYPDGAELQLRLVASKGDGIFGDIAIDHIRLHGSQLLDFPTNLMYVDSDDDGFGAPGDFILTCLSVPPDGFAFDNTDCDDTRPEVNPTAEEIPCNGIDENCNLSEQDDDLILPVPMMTSDTVCSGILPNISAAADPEFQVFWYTEADRSSGIVWVGNTYQPQLPANTTAFPQEYTFYAEVTNFVCTTPILGEATVVILPEPLGQVEDTPQVCPGDVLDLASINIVDTRFTGASLSFHTESPASGANQLGSTEVHLVSDSSFVYLLTSPDGCLFEDELTVSLRDLPEISFLPADSFSLCRDLQDTIIAEVSGGVPPYNYSWENGRTTSSFPVQAATQAGLLQEFALAVTDAQGCIIRDTALLQTTNSIDSLRAFTTPVTTCEGSDGTITVVPLNGLPPFSYVWEDESGNSDFGNGVLDTIRILDLPQNTYRVTITDSSAEGCEVQLRSLRIQGPGFQVGETTLSSPTCAGFADGEICLDVSGNGNLSYTWSDAQTTACAENLVAGSYSVTITNGECTTIESYELTEPDSLKVLVQSSSPSCSDADDGALMVSGFGGTPGYEYLWENGFIIPQRLNLTAGGYPLTITDNNNCQLIGVIELTAPEPLTIQLDSLVNSSCPGEKDGLIRVSGVGGTAPYQFVWADGSTAPLRIGLDANDYEVTITDFNGCTNAASFTVAPAVPLEIGVDNLIQPLCRGDETGAINLLASGGSPPYLFNWSDGVVGSQANRNNLPVDNYWVILADANGCLADTLFVDLEPQSNLIISAVLTEPSCVGLSDGAISISASGVEPQQYAWSNGANNALNDNIPVGSYDLIVTDARGCLADTTIQLDAEQVFLINSTVVQPSCFGVNDGIIDQTLIQQGQPPFQFFWNFDNSQHVDQMFLGPGEYQFTVTDAVGCSFTSDTFRLSYPAPLTLEVVDFLDITCNGDENGYIETQLHGGTAPYNFNWIGTGNTTSTLAGVGAGEYRLSVTDARGCDFDTTFVLTDPDLISIQAELQAGNVCDPDDPDVLVSQVQGGVGPYQYLWTGRIDDQTILDPIPGDYVLTIVDANGCLGISATVKVPERDPPLVLDSFVVQQVSCFEGEDATLSAFTSGGSGRLRYHFTPTYIEETDTNQLTITGLGFDLSYSVTITDLETGCEVNSVEIAGEQPDPISIQRDSFSVVNCFGGADGSIYVSVMGGTLPYAFEWTNEEGTVVSTMEDHRFARAGIFDLLVTDLNGCEATYSDSNVVSINELIVIADTLIHPVSCRDGNDGGIEIEVGGGVPPFSYIWSNDEMTQDLENVPAGIYTLTVTDSDTCRAIFPGLRIPEPSLALEVDGMTDSVSCFGFADGGIMANVMGGSMPYELRWRRNGNLIPSLQGLTLEDLIAANYELEVTDSNGCIVSTEFAVAGPEEIIINIINDPLGIDSLVAMVSGGVPPYEYLWSNGDTTAVITELMSANYQVLVTDSTGCMAEQSFVLTSSAAPLGYNGQISLFPNPSNGLLRLQLEDFPPELRIEAQWYNNLGQPIGGTRPVEQLNSTDFDLSNWPAGTYWLRLFDVKSGQYWSTKVIRL